MKKFLLIISTLSLFALFAILNVQFEYRDRIGHNPQLDRDLKISAMVLGASIKSDGTPSDALRDRLDEGIRLYITGVADNILLTGDDGAFHVNEISVMKRYAIEKQVPKDKIVVDGKGYRTYESCKHAAEMQKAGDFERLVVITQRFHMGRALYLCNKLGADAIGSTSDAQIYRRIVYFWLRDLASSAKAWWEINIRAPAPPVEI